MIRVVVLDTRTGMLAVDDQHDIYWWYLGNGGCDCNRARLFGLRHHRTNCLGCKRFLVVSCSDPTYTLCELNSGYPERLVAEFCEGQYADAQPDGATK
jgi:hypothetical protein